MRVRSLRVAKRRKASAGLTATTTVSAGVGAHSPAADSGELRRSRRVARQRASVDDVTQMTPPGRSFSNAATVMQAASESDRNHKSLRQAPRRRKQPKAPSAVVPKTLPRAAKDAKRRRVPVASDDRRLLHFGLLQSAFSSEDDGIDDTSWLSSTFLDLMLWRLAGQYPSVHFLPTDFFHCVLESRSHNRSQHSRTRHVVPDSDFRVRDVLGRPVDYCSDRPLLFAVNCGRIHWNLFRVQLTPQPELQLFEPMGRLSSRSGLSHRSVPRSVVEWLESCYPQYPDWISRAVSAITAPQQVSGFDCGVACLLYADKCGQGQTRQEIDARTDQRAITKFRTTLQQQLRVMQSSSGSSDGAAWSPALER